VKGQVNHRCGTFPAVPGRRGCCTPVLYFGTLPAPGYPGRMSPASDCATVDPVSDLDEIRNRVDVLETEVTRLREEAAATRTLAALADRDASEVRGALRAHTQALNALRETQVEQGRAQEAQTSTLRTIAEAVGGLTTHLQRHDDDLSEIKAMLRNLTDQS
jgi:hypothetical protein